MPDSSKLQYYTGYNAYKNLQVRTGSISVTTATVTPGSTRNFDTIVTVEPDSRFTSALIEANEETPPTVSALRWQAFPPANKVWQTLSVAPPGVTAHDMDLSIIVNDDQVTFRAQTFNPYAADLAFNTLTINFEYAVHTTTI